MQEEPKDKQTEQTPTGLTVPVPKRDEFFGNLKKAAKPADSAPPFTRPSQPAKEGVEE